MILLSERSKLVEKISEISGIEEHLLLPWIGFLLAIHDIGKIADSFQNKKPEFCKRFRINESKTSSVYRHTDIGYHFLLDNIIEAISGRDDEYMKDLLIPWLSAATGHHGIPPYLDISRYDLDKLFPSYAKDVAILFIKDVHSQFLPDYEFPFDTEQYDELDKKFKNISWFISGLVVVSDWIGSNMEWFKYHEECIPLSEYWERAKESAQRAVKESKMTYANPSDFLGMKLFTGINSAAPLQILLEKIEPLEIPHLFIIEELTGGGKTEAGLILTHRLMSKGMADGFFLALPTMATSNAMYERIESIYKSLYEGLSSPSLILAHSSSKMMVENFGRDNKNEGEDYSGWLWDNRKKALLGNVGVGTIDQALLSILPVRHHTLRLFGLIGKVLIIDEVHACDEYVLELLSRLLKFHAAFKGSVILMSATLPKSMKNKLIKAYSEGVGITKIDEVNSKGYPLLTILNYQEGLREISFEGRSDVSRFVKIEIFHDEAKVKEYVLKMLETGGCVCVIKNTIKDSLDAYDSYINELESGRIILFHSRFTLSDRLKIEKKVLQYFGPQSRNKDRKGMLLIATQVVEQSLDIDFDYMVTDLCPIDLIIQRAGRLRRHTRDLSGNPIKDSDRRGIPTLGVLMPQLVENPSSDWYKTFFPSGAYVYPHHGWLWLTAKWLTDKLGFAMPEQSREMIEYVYDENNIPDGLKKVEEKAKSEEMAAKSYAINNALSLELGYIKNDFFMDDDINAPTRLGEPTTSVRLGRIVDGEILPYYCDDNYAWQMSQLTVRTFIIKSEADKWKDEIKAVKARMGDKGKYSVLIPLERDGIQWKGKALNGKGAEVEIIYDEQKGLRINGGVKE